MNARFAIFRKCGFVETLIFRHYALSITLTRAKFGRALEGFNRAKNAVNLSKSDKNSVNKTDSNCGTLQLSFPSFRGKNAIIFGGFLP